VKNKILVAIPILAILLMSSTIPVEIHNVEWVTGGGNEMRISGSGFACDYPQLNSVYVNENDRKSTVISGGFDWIHIIPFAPSYNPIVNEVHVKVCVADSNCDEGTFPLVVPE